MRPITKSADERFWEKVSIAKINACWEWKGCTERIADQYNVSQATISLIKLRKTWNHI